MEIGEVVLIYICIVIIVETLASGGEAYMQCFVRLEKDRPTVILANYREKIKFKKGCEFGT